MLKPLNSSKIFAHSSIIFVILFIIYAISYNGVPGTDDEQLFISEARNWVDNGELTAPQMSGNSRIQGNYFSVGTLHPLTASGLYSLIRNFDLGQAQAMFLLPAIYTAITAVVIFLISLQNEFSIKISLAASFIFGLATIAWPYSQTFFRETLAMLLLCSSWLFFDMALRKRDNIFSGLFYWCLFSALFIGAVFTKIIILALFPYFLLAAYLKLDKKKVMVVIAVSGLISILVFTIIELSDIQTRFSIRFFSRSFDLFWRQFRRLGILGFSSALTGIFLSPGKGLIIYSPIFFFIFISLPEQWRAHWKITIFPIYALFSLTILQIQAYGSSWWNISWGTRFLLPVIPLLTIALLPTLDKVIHQSKSSWQAKLFLILLFLSVLTQLSGVLVADADYLKDIYSNNPGVPFETFLWDLKYSPPLANWRLLSQGLHPNLAAWHNFSSNPIGVISLLFAEVGLLAVSSYLLLTSKSLKSNEIPKYLRTGIFLTFICILIIPSLILRGFQNEPRYFSRRDDIVSASEWIAQEATENDVILIHYYLSPIWYFFFNAQSPITEWYSLSPAASLMSENTITYMDDFSGEYERIIIIYPGQTLNDLSQYLNDSGMVIEVVEDHTWKDINSEDQTNLIVFRYSE